jgi:hypothetical protein
VGSHFKIHFYDLCRVRPSTPDLWCITVVTQGSFSNQRASSSFLVCMYFVLFLFECSSFKLIVIFRPMMSIKKTDCPLLQKRSEKNKED